MSVFEQSKPNSVGFRDVTPELVAGVAAGNPESVPASLRLIDVREPHEFTGELGHVARAELVPLATVAEVAHDWDRDLEYVMICRSGGRSGHAAQQLTAMGFTKVMNMVGGMIAFNQGGYPVER